MTIHITVDQLNKINNSSRNSTFVDLLNKTMDKYDINTKPRIACFLSQVMHESVYFKFTEENLNYSAKGLVATFHKYFPTLELANAYAYNPQKIANKVYANRMGNGNEASGDGFNFKGRGLIQITGKNNYTAFANGCGLTLQQAVDYMKTPAGATISAGWFWDTNKLNIYCDKNDYVGLTKRINGGTIGLPERVALYNKIVAIL